MKQVNQHTDEPAVYHWVKGQKNIPLISFEQVAKVLKIAVLFQYLLVKLYAIDLRNKDLGWHLAIGHWLLTLSVE